MVDKSYFSTRKLEYCFEDLEGEIWIKCYLSPAYEVSNMGRIREKKTKLLLQGTINKNTGYHFTSILNRNHRTHRLIINSFDYKEDADKYTVDHINGIRSDNRLENLRWVSSEDNVMLMLLNRADLNKELTRIIQNRGYEATLELLKSLE